MVLLSDPENRRTSHRGVDLGHRYRIHAKQRLVAARGLLGGSFSRSTLEGAENPYEPPVIASGYFRNRGVGRISSHLHKMTGNGKKWHLPSVTMGVPIHWETEFRHAIF